MKTPFAIDKTVPLAINGSRQRVRLCAEREGLPPLLIVQMGPGFPLLNEVPKFQRRLHLETDFLVAYWDQRGCGPASAADARSVSVPQQVADLKSVLQWLRAETRQTVTVLGISLGGAFTLKAVADEPEGVRAVVVVSPDADTSRSDAAAEAFLREHGRPVERLGKPPCTTATTFQLRARWLTDLGAIEQGRKFGSVLAETLFGLLRAYGPVGAVKALRNMSLIQNQVLAEVASLSLLTNPPRVAVPVHYVFGEQDVLTPREIVQELPTAIAAPQGSCVLLPRASHVAHFDQPDVVRGIVKHAVGR